MSGIGLMGLINPMKFLSMAEFFEAASQQSLNLAAAVRICAGMLMIVAARRSRLPWVLYLIGAQIVLVGAITPLYGNEAAALLFKWCTSGGVALVMLWAGIALVLGGLVVYASLPWRASVSKIQDNGT